MFDGPCPHCGLACLIDELTPQASHELPWCARFQLLIDRVNQRSGVEGRSRVEFASQARERIVREYKRRAQRN